VAAGHKAIPPQSEKPPAYPVDRDHQLNAPKGNAAGGLKLRSGYALPAFQASGILILIDAPLSASLSRCMLKRDAMGGGLFCFRGKRGDLLKVIWHDGQGACLFTKRLERGRFIWPSVAGGSVTISPAQLSYLLSGIDWRNPQETQRPTRVG